MRKDITANSIIILALLVAILASATSIVNFLVFQAEAIGNLVNPSETIIVSCGSSLTESNLGSRIVSELENLTYVRALVPQKIVWANITGESGSFHVIVRGVKDVEGYLRSCRAYLNGSSAKGSFEACAGELVAKAFNLKVGEELNIIYLGNLVNVRVVGVFRTGCELDSELILPIDMVKELTGEYETVSMVEVHLKDGVSLKDALNDILRRLPSGVNVFQAQQLKAFIQQVNLQTVNFLNVWSTIIYFVVAVASYLISTRLVEESFYEFALLKALGAENKMILSLILSYTGIVSFSASILGVSLGLAGAQAASTALSWTNVLAQITPKLYPMQTIQIISLTLASSLFGCIYPAYKASRTRYEEKIL